METTMPGRNGGTLQRGQSPGRPKGSLSLKSILQKVLAEEVDGVTRAEQMIRDVIDLAAKGRASCLKFIKEYIEEFSIAETFEEILQESKAQTALMTESSVKPKPAKPAPSPEIGLFRRDKKKHRPAEPAKPSPTIINLIPKTT